MSRAADALAVAHARANALANAPKDVTASKTADAATSLDAKTPPGPDDAQWLAQFAAMMGHTHPGFPGPTAQAAALAAAPAAAQASATATALLAPQGSVPGQTAILTATAPTALVGTDGQPGVAASAAADGLSALTSQAPVDTDILGQVTNLLSGGQSRRADGVAASPTGAWSNAGDVASGVAKGAATALMRGADILPGFAAVAAAASAAADVANAAASAVAAASSALGGGAAGSERAGAEKATVPGAESSAASLVAATTESAALPLPTHGITAHGVPTLARADAPTIPGAPTPLNGQALQGRLDEALRWMAGNGLQNAELRVTPDALGPISIHVRLDGDTASVMFGSAHEQTRQALEASLAGLRDALAAAGMTLGDASVGSEQQQRQMMADSGTTGRRQSDPDATPSDVAAASGSRGAAPASQAGTATVAPRRGNGLLNVYA